METLYRKVEIKSEQEFKTFATKIEYFINNDENYKSAIISGHPAERFANFKFQPVEPQQPNNIPLKELDQLLFDCTQLFDGWHSDIVWSEWDESIRKRVSEFRKTYTYEK